MYQYKGESPQKAILFDWQISRYSSPVLDLVHFIFACTDEDLRAKHYDELLGIYHHSLSELLDNLAGDTDTQYPYSALLQQLKQFGKFGILMASMMIPILSMKNEDIPDMDAMAEKLSEGPEAMKDAMNEMTKGNDSSNSRMKAAIMDAVRFGYL